MNDIDIFLDESVSEVLGPKIDSAIDSHNIEQFVQDVITMLNEQHLTNTKMGDAIIVSLKTILADKHPTYSHIVDKYIILI